MVVWLVGMSGVGKTTIGQKLVFLLGKDNFNVVPFKKKI